MDSDDNRDQLRRELLTAKNFAIQAYQAAKACGTDGNNLAVLGIHAADAEKRLVAFLHTNGEAVDVNLLSIGSILMEIGEYLDASMYFSRASHVAMTRRLRDECTRLSAESGDKMAAKVLAELADRE